jgi:hypothetical protein
LVQSNCKGTIQHEIQHETDCKELCGIGGNTLLRTHYNGSPSLLLSEVYPEYEWLPWKFVMCPFNFWDDPKNQRKFMEWAAKQLNIQNMSDWYKISNKVTLPKKVLKFPGFSGYWR